MSRASFFDGADGANGAMGTLTPFGVSGADSSSANSFLGYSGTLSNPMLVNGLIQSRAGTLSGGSDPEKSEYPHRSHSDRLKMRDANTRGYLAQVELMSRIIVEANDDNGAGPCDIKYLVKEGKGEGYVAKTLATIVRPELDYFTKQLGMVLARANQRSDRTSEILSQIRPQYAYWASLCNLHPETTPRTIELTYSALHFSMLINQRLKHALDVPRPHVFSSRVQPIIMPPAYQEFPQGHAKEAYMFAKVIVKLIGSRAEGQLSEHLHRLAKRIGDNRVIAGVHAPGSTYASYVMADALAAYFVARCGGDPKSVAPRRFDVNNLKVKKISLNDGQTQSTELDPLDDVDPRDLEGFLGKEEEKFTIEQSPLMAAMWQAAQEELKRQG